jgi:hypothetical protein
MDGVGLMKVLATELIRCSTALQWWFHVMPWRCFILRLILPKKPFGSNLNGVVFRRYSMGGGGLWRECE